MDQSQFAYLYLSNDGTPYDVFAAQVGAHMSSPERTYSTTSEWSGPLSPGHDDDESETADSKQDGKSSGKSRSRRYKNCSEAALSRRRAQNRDNQRAYRRRKEERILELQQQLDEMSQRNERLTSAYNVLATECTRLRAGQSPMSAEASLDWQSGAALVDPRLLASPDSSERWWSSDL